MSGTLPSGVRGRLLALGVGLLLLALGWVAVAEPLIGWHASLAQAVENRGAVARRMQVVAASLPAQRRQAETAAADTQVTSSLLEGDTDALAGAALQARLRELASGAQVSLTSAESLPAEAVGGLRRIGVRVSATAEWPVLIGLLQALDRATPRMLVDDLQLQKTVVVSGSVARPLGVTLTVLAFRAAEAP